MKKAILLSLCVALGGCAWWASNGKAVATDTLTEIQCVVTGAQSGQTAEQIAVSCGIAAVSDVVAILSSTQTPVASSPTLTAVLAAHPAMKVVVKAPVAAKK